MDVRSLVIEARKVELEARRSRNSTSGRSKATFGRSLLRVKLGKVELDAAACRSPRAPPAGPGSALGAGDQHGAVEAEALVVAVGLDVVGDGGTQLGLGGFRKPREGLGRAAGEVEEGLPVGVGAVEAGS